MMSQGLLLLLAAVTVTNENERTDELGDGRGYAPAFLKI